MQKMSTHHLFSLAASVALIGAACKGSFATDPGPGKRVDVTLVRQLYAPGEVVNAVLANLTELSLDYSYSQCFITLERLDGSAWTAAVQASSACSLVQLTIGPNQSAPLGYRLAPDLTPGVYRLSFPEPIPMSAPSGSQPAPTLTTAQFTVSSGP